MSLGDSSTGGTLGINAATFSSTRAVVLGSAGGTIDAVGSTDATWSGSISGGGTGGLTKSGTGTLTLAGNNTYTGPTIVNAGTLVAGSSSAFGASRFLTVSAGGTANFNGFGQTFFSISGTGNIASGGASLTVGGDNSSSSFDVSLGGTGGLVKAGSGTLTLTGNNTFTGGITLGSGALSVSSDANLGGAGTLSMAGGTALNITAGGLYAHDVSLGGANAFNASPGAAVTWSGAISGSGGLKWNGTGTTLTLTNAANTYTGGTSISGGSTLAVTSDGSLGAAGAGIALGDATSTATLSVGSTLLISRPIVMGALGATTDTPGAANLTLGGVISGAGGLTKTGSGTLTLAGANTFTGPTVVLGGSLGLGRTNTLNPGSALSLASGTTFNVNGFSQTLAGVISNGTVNVGGGSLTLGSIAGSGALNLGGGTLTVGGDGSSSLFPGTVNGSGAFVKNGGGVLALTGANTLTGQMVVNSGTVSGNTSSLPAHILNNALVVFDQGSNGTYTGSVSGSGTLAKIGAGALTLAGANTYTGGTLVSAGSLIGTTNSLQGAFVNNAALVFDQSNDGTFLGVIAGTGSVTKQGTGLVNLTGGQGFTGLTSILGGRLGLDAGLPGSVLVGASGSLRAAGVIGGSLDVGGTLTIPAPGTSNATFNAGRMGLAAAAADQAPSLFVNGRFSSTPGSLLNMAVSPGGAAPIIVGGAATLQVTHLNVTINDPNPARNATYIGLTAAGGLTLSGVTASSTTAGLVPIVRGDPNALVLTLLNLASPFQTVTATGNGGAVARGLDRVKVGASGDFGNVMQELAALDDAQLNAALRALSGEIHASTLRLSTLDAQMVTDAVREELSGSEHDSEDQPATTAVTGSTRKQVGGHSLRPWVRFSADHGSFNSNGFSGTTNTGTPAGGVDFKPSGAFTVGGGAALGLGGMSLSDVSGSSSITAPRAFAYGGVGFGPFHFHGGGSAARQKTSTQRSIQFAAVAPNASGQLVPLAPARFSAYDGSTSGTSQPTSAPEPVDREADSDQKSQSKDGWSEFQNTFKRAGWIFDSKLAWRVAEINRDAFAETGADSLSLISAPSTLTTKEGTFEGHYYKRTGNWRPNILVSYAREVGIETTQADVNFAGSTASQFAVEGVPVPVSTFHGLFGLTVRTSGLEYTFEYETRQAKGESHNSVHFRLKFK